MTGMRRRTGKKQTSSKNNIRLSTAHPINVGTDGGGFDRRKSFDTRRRMGRSYEGGLIFKIPKFVVWPNAGWGSGYLFRGGDGLRVAPTEQESPSPTGRGVHEMPAEKVGSTMN